MNIPAISKIKYHNNVQLDYFGKDIKSTMIPVRSPYVLRHIGFLLDNTQINSNEKGLDVGCGMGKFTLPLLERGMKVSGLDLSPFLLTKFLEYNDNRFDVNLIASDILEAPEELNEKFDYIVGFFALHHFHNLHVCFQAMSRLVKPGGKIYFIEPNAWNILYYFQIFFTPGMSWSGDKGVAKMRRSVFQKAGDFAGLSEMKILKYGMFPPFLYNKKWGQRLEKIICSIPFFKPFQAFQLVSFTKPIDNGN